MIVWVYQKCKYKIENIKIDGIFVFLLLRKRISETRFNQNLSITKNFLKQKEQAFKKQPQCMNKNSKKKKKFGTWTYLKIAPSKLPPQKYEHKQEEVLTDKHEIRYLGSSHDQLLTAKWLLIFSLVQSSKITAKFFELLKVGKQSSML